MVSRSLVLGYHGCDLATAHKIVTGQEQQMPSSNNYDWLAFDSVRAFFVEGEPLYEKAGLPSLDH